jgi:hypothetical protein
MKQYEHFDDVAARLPLGYAEQFAANLRRLPNTNLQGGIWRYVMLGIEPGGFLRAVLENDLLESFGRADEDNRACLFGICSWMYNNAPMECRGSPAKVKAWLDKGGFLGMSK